MLFELFKRLLNSRASSQAADEQRAVANIELPVAQAQACLLLSRHMNPQPTQAQSAGLPQLVELINARFGLITRVSKDKCLKQGQVTCLLLNAFYNIMKRSQSQRQVISAILLQINIDFEKIAKQCIVEGDVRAAQSVLDLIKAILRMEDLHFQHQSSDSQDSWVLESDRLNSTGTCMMGEPQELLRHQMFLDSAACTEAVLRLSGVSAMYQLSENASLTQPSQSPFKVLSSLH